MTPVRCFCSQLRGTKRTAGGLTAVLPLNTFMRTSGGEEERSLLAFASLIFLLGEEQCTGLKNQHWSITFLGFSLKFYIKKSLSDWHFNRFKWKQCIFSSMKTTLGADKHILFSSCMTFSNVPIKWLVCMRGLTVQHVHSPTFSRNAKLKFIIQPLIWRIVWYLPVKSI